ncbi:ankyrin, partial [Wilcoxina mikolae CBS 423.85]
MSSYNPDRTALSLQSLPTELHILIGDHLSPTDLVRLFRTNNYFYALYFDRVYHGFYAQSKPPKFTRKSMRSGFRCRTGGHALLRAAQGGHAALVTRLLSAVGRSCVNTTCERCSTALHLAIRYGHLKLAISLITLWKADITIRCIIKGTDTDHKYTPLEMLVDLLSDEFDFSLGSKPPKPQVADAEAIVTLFRLLFENIESTKVSSLSGHGFIAQIAGTKPCHIPAEVKVPIIALLLERGAPVEPPDDVYKRSSLFNEELANRKVDNKCQEDRWWGELEGVEELSLHAAVYGGHKAVVQQLLRAGANINRRNHRGETVLHFINQKTCPVLLQCD